MEMKHIDHVGVHVADAERSIAFYQDVMLCHVVEQTTMVSGTTLVFLRAGTSEEAGLIELIVPPADATSDAARPRGRGNISHFCFHVDDLDAWIAHLQRHNVPITSGPAETVYPSGKVRLLFCTDPDGVSIELYEREREV